MVKTERFILAMTQEDKAALQRLAARERIPAAAVVRRLIWREAQTLIDSDVNKKGAVLADAPARSAAMVA